jgi:hypothetical protein
VAFEHRWANSVLAEVFSLLRQEAVKEGVLERFKRLEGFLVGEFEGIPQDQATEELGMSVLSGGYSPFAKTLWV